MDLVAGVDRADRVGADHDEVRVLLAQVARHAGDRAAGADADDEVRQAPAGLAPQLRPGRVVVRLRVGRVAVLVRLERAGDLLGQAVGDAVVGLRRLRRDVGRRDHDLGAVGAQQVDLLARHLVRHHRDHAVALQARGDREARCRCCPTSARRACRRGAGCRPLGRLDQPQRDAVLDRAARVEQLHLGDELRLEAGADAAQPHERRLADRVEDRVSDVGLQRGVRDHGVESTTPPGGEIRARPAYGSACARSSPSPCCRSCLLAAPRRRRARAATRSRPASASRTGRGRSGSRRRSRPRTRRARAARSTVRRPQSDEGMMVRNVVGPGHAPHGATAALRFDAPPGTTITGADFDVAHDEQPGLGRGHPRRDERRAGCGAGAAAGARSTTGCTRSCAGSRTQRVQALVRCAATRCRRDARHGFVAIRNVRVYLDDPSLPRLDGAARHRWSRPAGRGCAAPATSRSTRPTTAASGSGGSSSTGASCTTDARGCDFTRAVPCSGATVGARLDTRTWADGEHVLRLAAQDAGGNWSVGRPRRAGRQHARRPSRRRRSRAVTGWSPSRARTLVLPLPGGQAAPLTRARCKACRVGGACEESAPALRRRAGEPAAAVPVAAFDGPGEYAVRVALEDAAGQRRPRSPRRDAALRRHAPGRARRLRRRRVAQRRRAPARSTRRAQRPVSGIRGYRVRIGGREAVVATSLPLDELPEGGTPVEVSAVSGAGLEGTAVRTTLSSIARARSRPPRARRTAGRARRCGSRCAGATRPGCPACARSRGRSTTATRSPPRASAPTVEVAADGRHTVVLPRDRRRGQRRPSRARDRGQGRPHAARDGRVRGARSGRPAPRARRRRRQHVGRRVRADRAAPRRRGLAAGGDGARAAIAWSRVLDDATLRGRRRTSCARVVTRRRGQRDGRHARAPTARRRR